MRPPILQWKVSVALLAVVIAAVSLGSALHSTGTPQRTFFTYGINTDIHSKLGRVQVYDSTGKLTPTMRREMRHEECVALTTELRRLSRSETGALRQAMRGACRKHR